MVEEFELSRRRAALAILPFVALGVADVVLLLLWGLDPLWGFLVLPPILAISLLGWVAFRGGFVRDRVGDDPAAGTEPVENDRDPGY